MINTNHRYNNKIHSNNNNSLNNSSSSNSPRRRISRRCLQMSAKPPRNL